ncbi:MAG: protein translocase subunit SecD [Acidobacteriota bacterium]
MWKWILIAIVVIGTGFLTFPPKQKIKLGLDLKGGMHLVLKVETNDALNMETDHQILRIQDLFKEKIIKYSSIKKLGVSSFEIEGIDSSQEDEIKNILDQYFIDWDYSIFSNVVRLSMRLNIATQIRDQSVSQAIETIRNRVDEFGVAEPVIQRQGMGGERILVQLPGVSDPDRVKAIIKSTALLEWKLVVAGPAPSEEALLKDFGGVVPGDADVVRGDPRKGVEGFYLLKKVAAVTGKDIRNARRSTDEFNQPVVSFTLSSAAGKIFEKVTSQNIGKPLAIVLDNKVISAPTIQATIRDQGIITGRFSIEEVDDLSLVLRSGSLPASIKYLEERTVGPSLGIDSIRKGLTSYLIALVLVILFMIIYYKAAGVNAFVALIFNMIILLGVMSYFKATLTLPGIAGIILTVGMAVDANVLIFERIREDLRLGKTVRAAIASGFSKAFVTILDSNITTIIAAVFLFQFGTGPVKGFAVTLIIGIVASMFTAVFVSRNIFELIISKRRKIEKLSI